MLAILSRVLLTRPRQEFIHKKYDNHVLFSRFYFIKENTFCIKIAFHLNSMYSKHILILLPIIIPVQFQLKKRLYQNWANKTLPKNSYFFRV